MAVVEATDMEAATGAAADAAAAADADAVADAAAAAVPERVSVYWTDEKRWYKGRVVASLKEYDGKISHHVLYDDGDDKWHDFQVIKWRPEAVGAPAKKRKEKQPQLPKEQSKPGPGPNAAKKRR